MFSYRAADIEDLDLIQTMAGDAFPATYSTMLEPEQIDYMLDMMYSSESLKKQMTEDNHRYYIAYYKDEPCGYLSLQHEKEDLFHLQKIYILPAFQKQGVGRFLIELAFNLVLSKKKENPVRIELNVNRDNNASKFYEHMGFRISHSGDFPIGNGYYMTDHIMFIDL